MTLQSDTSDIDEFRQIEADAAPTRFARGWHCLGLTRDFGDGKPHAVHAFGQKLVVFRGGDRKIGSRQRPRPPGTLEGRACAKHKSPRHTLLASRS